jgi:hypothetical protein
VDEGGDAEEIVLLDLGRNEDGRVLGMAVYTSPVGEAQDEHLSTYTQSMPLTIAPVSLEELLEAMRRSMPNSVFLDGQKIAGSVFMGMVKEELGLPIQHPRSFKAERIFKKHEEE